MSRQLEQRVGVGVVVVGGVGVGGMALLVVAKMNLR